MIVDRAAVLRFRLAANYLDRRLPQGSLATAAAAGLQDGSPWSGLLSLHARVEEVPLEAWEDPDLAQVFGPRGAIYLVPSADVAVFTLGQLPRDPHRVAEIEAEADRCVALLHHQDGLPNTRGVRWAGATGRLLARWDARTTTVIPAPRPDADAEWCRLELARRLLHFRGPATARQLAWYVEGSGADAKATLAALRDELVSVDVPGEDRWLLAADEDALAAAGEVRGVRLLPPDDPVLSRADKALLAPDPERRRQVWPKAPAPGALLVDGEIAGTWRRQGHTVTVTSWGPGPEDEVWRETAAMPLGGEAEVRWA